MVSTHGGTGLIGYVRSERRRESGTKKDKSGHKTGHWAHGASMRQRSSCGYDERTGRGKAQNFVESNYCDRRR
ncbi:hypothetical protein QE152_g29863 [Popillia japonica]|uniref:Uncharacterized protein n=1 Tax=Popillia japonica TaxID=7064 RepID=A0AAW1JGD7_POPJA